MKKIFSTGVIMTAMIFGFSACNQEQGAVEEATEANEQKFEDSEMESKRMDQADFLITALNNSMLEVQAGELAMKQAQNQQVKDFANMLVNDHKGANDKIMELANSKNITLPDSLGEDKMDKLKELQEKTGKDFNMAYMDMTVSAHEDAVELFEEASNNLEDTEVKTFASNTLAKMREHLERSKQLKEAIEQEN